MKVKLIAFGNSEEAFIESRISEGVNIIYSNENNKGKTLIFQGLMYSLGNEPIFPSGFNYKDYYFYSKIVIKNTYYEFLRYHNTFIIMNDSIFQVCDGESELKYFVHKNIFNLPIIEKKGHQKVVDLQLFYQLFFVGQDKRNPSNVIITGYYNKFDFINMLSSYNGYIVTESSIEETSALKENIKEKQSEINRIRKLIKFSKNNPLVNSFVNEYADNDAYREIKEKLTGFRDSISTYKRKRNRETNRLLKLNSLVKELNSLNQTIDSGKIVCSDCGSTNILYVNSKMNFDISNIDVRNQIINSIRETITIKDALINEYIININNEQFKIKELLRLMPVEIQSILIYSDEIKSIDQYNHEIFDLQNDIDEIKNNIEKSKNIDSISKEKRIEMQKKIIESMNRHYHEITKRRVNAYHSLFTQKDETFSGSDEQEFYYCKLLALNEFFDHSFPIIIDSFRNGELSTTRENRMLEGYKKLNKQVILSATLKTEEYDNLKYQEIDQINAIDYSQVNDRKLLSEEHAKAFVEIISRFNITFNN